MITDKTIFQKKGPKWIDADDAVRAAHRDYVFGLRRDEKISSAGPLRCAEDAAPWFRHLPRPDKGGSQRARPPIRW